MKVEFDLQISMFFLICSLVILRDWNI